MDNQRWLRASSHLDEALDLPPEARAACLARLRSTDPETADDVEALLEEHRRLNDVGFLDTPAAAPGAAVPAIQAASLAGQTIGAYTLVSSIGDGGMGTVWLAVRSDGRFEGHAALKLLKTALIGGGGEDRFQREGTILARLAHPHIARLIDAGVAPWGQPYLVLERVDGRHIDRYCDEERLDIDTRIRLFLDVQAAVAHAHANLIVHRDLKPSNVLVDKSGQVKLLDFGIAKLLEDHSAQLDPAMTHEGSPALTPKYAAPEQVTGGAITTATDVYALGVLLFELLTGQHPTSAGATTPAQFVRTVVDETPARLTDAVDRTDADTRARIAAARGTTQERLRRRLGGDLETILGKALKKAPEARYVSVAEFADDLRRYLDHQPISARPDAVSYRAAMFVRRHRPALSAAALVGVAIIGLVAYYTLRLADERDRATLEATKAQRVSELLTSLLTVADPYRTPDGSEATVGDLLDLGAQRAATELVDQPDVQVELLTGIGRTYQRMGLLDKALPLEEQAVAIGRRSLGEHVTVAQSLNNLGVLYRAMGQPARAEPLLRESLAMRRRLLGNVDKDVAVTLVELARVLQDRGLDAEAEPLTREALAVRQSVFGDEHRETATSKNELGLLLWRRGDLDGAERLMRENLDTSTRVLGVGHPNVAASTGNLALIVLDKGDPVTAERLLRESLADKERVFGKAHAEYALTLNSLGTALEAQDRLVEAQRLLEQAVAIMGTQPGVDNPRALIFETNLARVRVLRGDGASLEATLRRTLDARRRIYPPGNWRIGQSQSLLGASLLAQRRFAEAEPLLTAADAALQPIAGQQERERIANTERLAAVREALAR